MSKALTTGSIIASSIATSILFLLVFPPRRTSSAAPGPLEPMGPPPPPGWEPAPSNIPSQQVPPPITPAPSNLPNPTPQAPNPPWPEPPRPPIAPRMVNILAGHRYRVTVDLKPAKGKGLASAARAVIASPRFAGRFEDMERRSYDEQEKPGVGEVWRVVFDVTPTVHDSFPIDVEIPVQGAGSVWIVSVVEVKR